MTTSLSRMQSRLCECSQSMDWISGFADLSIRIFLVRFQCCGLMTSFRIHGNQSSMWLVGGGRKIGVYVCVHIYIYMSNIEKERGWERERLTQKKQIICLMEFLHRCVGVCL